MENEYKANTFFQFIINELKGANFDCLLNDEIAFGKPMSFDYNVSGKAFRFTFDTIVSLKFKTNIEIEYQII